MGSCMSFKIQYFHEQEDDSAWLQTKQEEHDPLYFGKQQAREHVVVERVVVVVVVVVVAKKEPEKGSTTFAITILHIDHGFLSLRIRTVWRGTLQWPNTIIAGSERKCSRYKKIGIKEDFIIIVLNMIVLLIL